MTRWLCLTALLTLACGDKDDDETGAAGDGSDGTGADGADGADGTGSDGSDGSDGTGEDFTLTVPAATSSAGHPLEATCPWQLSVDYECDNPNPAVSWTGVPAGTVAFALVFDDPDAGGFDHWAVINIPASESGLDEGISGESLSGGLPSGAAELTNGFGYEGYLGSCPPAPHTYRWRLWALSEPLDSSLTSFSEVEAAAEAVSLGMAEACHVYGPRS